MVMHARKHPRLNDGYYDRNSPDMLQHAQYPSKTNHSDRYRRSHDRDSSPEDRDSPRYVNKSSYIERAREKVERGVSRSSLDSRINHLTSSGMSSNTLASLVHKNALARSAAMPSSSSRSSSSMQRSKSYSASSHAASSSSRDGKTLEARKADILKSARRVCGDWSEHISSSGKKYYYNCQTEVSQWEKPRQWMDMYREINRGESREIDRRQFAAKSYNDRGKHSIQSENRERIVIDRNNSRNSTNSDIANRPNYVDRQSLPKSNSVPSSSHLLSSSVPSYNKQQQHRHVSSSEQLSSSSHYQGTPENEVHRQSSGGTYRDYSSTPSYRDESTYQREIGHAGSTNMLTTSGSIRYERRDCVTNALSTDGYSSSRASDIRRNETDNSQNIDGMEISPSRTPTSSSSFSRANSRQLSHTPQQAHPQHVQHHTASVIDSCSVNTALPRLLASHSPLSPSRGGASNLLSPGSASMPLPSLSSLQSPFTSAMPQGISALPHLISHLSERQQKDSQDKTHKALHTLQMLQEALTRQVSLAQTMVQSQGTTSSVSSTTHNNSTQPYSSSSNIINNIAINTGINSATCTTTTTTTTTSHSVTTPNQMNSPSPHRGVMKSPLRTGFSTSGMHCSMGLPTASMTNVSSSPLHSTVSVTEMNSNSSTTVMLTSRVGGPHEEENGGRAFQELSPSRSPAHTLKEEPCVNGGHGTVVAPLVKQSSFELSSSHIDYYNDELTSHVKGWQGNDVQKQVVKVMEEGVLVHQGQCAVICAELKRARSLVRLTEIQSTLHEQRILSLKQHVAEIENMKTQTNFMSS